MIKVIINGNEVDVETGNGSLEYKIIAGSNLTQYDAVNYLGSLPDPESKTMGVSAGIYAEDEEATIIISGVTKCKLDGSVIAGAKLTAGSTAGRFKNATGTMPVCGRALQDGNDGDLIDCIIVA